MAMQSSQIARRQRFGRTAPWRRKAAATMGIIALLLLAVTVSRQRIAPRVEVLQRMAEDQRNFRDVKSAKAHQTEIFRDLVALDSARRAQEYAAEVERYRMEAQEIDLQVRMLEKERAFSEGATRWLYFGGTFLEIAIVVCSVAILTRRRVFWLLSLLGGAAGVMVSLIALL